MDPHRHLSRGLNEGIRESRRLAVVLVFHDVEWQLSISMICSISPQSRRQCHFLARFLSLPIHLNLSTRHFKFVCCLKPHPVISEVYDALTTSVGCWNSNLDHHVISVVRARIDRRYYSNSICLFTGNRLVYSTNVSHSSFLFYWLISLLSVSQRGHQERT